MKGLSAVKLFIFMPQFIWNPIMIQFNQKILRDEIKWLLEAITEQFEAIDTYEEKIPQIEFDIIMDNIRKVYQDLHMLNHNTDAIPHFHPSTSFRPAESPVAPVTESEDQESAHEEVPQPALSEEKSSVQPLVKVLVDTAAVETERIEPDAEETPLPEMDLFSTEMSEFSEKLKEIREKNYASERQASQRKELKASISINEKFLFINELFDGNLREYNAAIEILNNFSDQREALEFLDSMRIRNLLESESPAFKRLTVLVEQRY